MKSARAARAVRQADSERLAGRGSQRVVAAQVTRLHQFNMEYVAEEDRLLLRVQTVDHNEFLVWLTRRYVKQLWPLLVKLLERDPDAAR